MIERINWVGTGALASRRMGTKVHAALSKHWADIWQASEIKTTGRIWGEVQTEAIETERHTDTRDKCTCDDIPGRGTRSIIPMLDSRVTNEIYEADHAFICMTCL